MGNNKKIQRLSTLGEFGWLKKLIPRLYWPSSTKSQLCIGPGDDAGVLRISPGRVLVATTDAMVEGIHFERRWMPWKILGEKILSVNLSDLAAMGDVKPLAALVTAAFPGDTPVRNVDNFYKGLDSCAQRWKTGLLGGDTVGSKKGWFVSVTVVGEARSRGLVRRDGAKPGDHIVTTGPLGMAAAGLEVLQAGQAKAAWTRPLVRAFLHPQPRLAAGSILGRRHLATSMMDCSDGLKGSVKLLAESSGVGAEIQLSDLPLPQVLGRWAALKKKAAWQYVLQGGEDYELIFTIRPQDWIGVKSLVPQAVRIGRIMPAGYGCRAIWKGRVFSLEGYGYSHFPGGKE